MTSQCKLRISRTNWCDMTLHTHLKNIADDFEMDGMIYFPSIASTGRNPFSGHKHLTLEHCMHMSKFWMEVRQEFHAESLLWSGTKLLNSCDEELQQKIEEKTLQFGVKHKMGIVCFHVMINLIQSSSAPAMRAVTKKLETLQMTRFPVENVLTASSFIKGAIQQLGMNTLQDIIS